MTLGGSEGAVGSGDRAVEVLDPGGGVFRAGGLGEGVVGFGGDGLAELEELFQAYGVAAGGAVGRIVIVGSGEGGGALEEGLDGVLDLVCILEGPVAQLAGTPVSEAPAQ